MRANLAEIVKRKFCLSLLFRCIPKRLRYSKAMKMTMHSETEKTIIPNRVAKFWLEATMRHLSEGLLPARLSEQVAELVAGETDNLGITSVAPRTLRWLEQKAIARAQEIIAANREQYAPLIEYFRNYKSVQEIVKANKWKRGLEFAA